MSTLTRWFEVPALCNAPFLAINLSNSKPKTRAKNAQLYDDGKTGDWPLNQALRGEVLIGQTIVLYYRLDRGNACVYTGKCARLRKNGVTKDGRTRFRFTTADGWHLQGQTTVPFTRFFGGFTMSSNATVVWAAPERYTELEDDVSEIDDVDPGPDVDDPSDDPDDDKYSGVVGAETMAEVALRAQQRLFAHRVAKVWGNKCALTGLAAPRLLQACHIVPYKDSSPLEKVTAHNGLLLCAHLHMLMDAHLLSFDDDGSLLIANGLNADVRALVVAPRSTQLRRTPSAEQVTFLRRHRNSALSIGNVLARVE